MHNFEAFVSEWGKAIARPWENSQVAHHVPSLSPGYSLFLEAVSMPSKSMRIVLASAASLFLFAGLAWAQSSKEGKRKIKWRTNPVYPEIAKRMNITGKVRIELVIASDGRVKSSRALGGHPLLVQACQAAVKEWRFLPGAEESTQVYEFDFTAAGD